MNYSRRFTFCKPSDANILCFLCYEFKNRNLNLELARTSYKSRAHCPNVNLQRTIYNNVHTVQ